jgi:hypothetical protein
MQTVTTVGLDIAKSVFQRQPANLRVQAIGSDHEVEMARRCALEFDAHAVAFLLNSCNAVAENGFAAALNPAIN